MGTMVSEAATITDEMFLVAAQALAASVSDERLAAGTLYPSVERLGDISRSVGLAVASEAVRSGVARTPAGADLGRLIDDATWWPAYVPYIKARPAPEPLAG